MDANNVNPTNDGKPYDEEKTLKEILEQTQLEMEALQAEFNVINPESNAESIRKALVAAAPQAIQQIITLSHYAESESVRANTSKYIIDVASGKNQIGDQTETELTKLLRDLKGTPIEEKEASEKES